jgi:hypothetical protein
MSIVVPVGEYQLDGCQPTGGTTISNAHPIEYEDDSILVNPAAMVLGHPYAVQYRDKQAVAVKHQDGSIVFYQIPD